MPKCKKCGESLHPEQKACLSCGTQTDLWPGGATEEEKKPTEIPWTPIAIIAGGLIAFIVIIALALHIRIIPPDQVTRQWVSAVSSRNIDRAKLFTTEKFENASFDQAYSARKADEYQQFICDNRADYKVERPVYDSPDHPTKADVTVKFTGENGVWMTQLVKLVLEGRKWKVAGAEQNGGAQ
jgi:uncharacterized membrane protein YvbJ